jgi:hypothetical protein
MDANQLAAAEARRRERAGSGEVITEDELDRKRGTLFVYNSHTEATSAEGQALVVKDVLVTFQDRTLIATFRNGDIEFFALVPGGVAVFERNRAEQ